MVVAQTQTSPRGDQMLPSVLCEIPVSTKHTMLKIPLKQQESAVCLFDSQTSRLAQDRMLASQLLIICPMQLLF